MPPLTFTKEIEKLVSPVDGAELLDDISQWFSDYIWHPDDVKQETCDMLALWSIATWYGKQTKFFPMICITSPSKMSGKTLAIEMLEWICNKSLKTSGAGITTAVLFRLSDRDQPVFLIDEAEHATRDNERLSLLNSGYKKGARALRCQGGSGTNGSYSVVSFNSSGFRLFASLKRLDPTITSRAINLQFERFPKGTRMRQEGEMDIESQGLDFVPRIMKFTKDTQRKYAKQQYVTVKELKKQYGSESQVARTWDVWSPLFAIADLAGGAWLDRAVVAMETLEAKVKTSGLKTSERELLLQDIFLILEEEKWPDRIQSQDLCDELNKMESSPWGDYRSREGGLTTIKLARMLKPFKIEPSQWKTEQGYNRRGYYLSTFRPSFERYLPEQSGKSGLTIDVEEKTPVDTGLSDESRVPQLADEDPPELIQ